jgi:V-type H+-transporting ATPase subunit a
MGLGVMTRIEDLTTVLRQTQDHRHRLLVAAAKNLHNWFISIRKIKSVYHTMNSLSLDVTQKCLIAECWMPSADLEIVELALKRGTERAGSTVPPILNKIQTKEDPPSFHRVNKITSGFQNLIDSYGVATYREVNPAPFTIISFPYLFSLMYGDIGHGTLMFLSALFLVLNEKKMATAKNMNEILIMFFHGRYIILFMGAFSIYSGWMYNDIFSRSINIFGSSFHATNITLSIILFRQISFF